MAALPRRLVADFRFLRTQPQSLTQINMPCALWPGFHSPAHRKFPDPFAALDTRGSFDRRVTSTAQDRDLIET
jgi:hypothetical protein